MAMWLSRLERGTHNAEVGGSSPPIATIFFLTNSLYKDTAGILLTSQEHCPTAFGGIGTSAKSLA